MNESPVTDKVAVCGDAVVQEVNEYVEIAKAWLFEKGIDFAINAAVALVILLVGWIAIKVISALVNRAMTKGGMKKTLFTDLVTSVVRKGCWAVLIVMVLSRLGINVGPIIAGLGVTGFILGFAFQESLGNLASGLMIAINEPFKVGDYVIVAGLDGEVLKVDMMATVLATADNKKVVIPNKSAWGSPITNFSALGRRRVDLKVGIAYSSDIGKAIQIALDTLNKLPGVLQEPKADVSIASLDDSAVTLNVRPWANCSDYWGVYSGGYKAVKEAFDANGIAIPFPQMDVHLNQQ